jgi:hypothetical protein
MARSRITAVSNDLISDSGSVLFSFIRGEQLEFPITLNFIANASAGYTYEAVVVEGLNVEGQTSAPVTIRPSGVQITLTVRVPTYRGNWDSASAYNREEIILYSTKYYKLLAGVARTNSTPPDEDPFWEETVPNKIYVQFPKTLSISPAWNQAPVVNSPVYGFFELRVTEASDAIFIRTWKPMRGLIEILFSPTDIVPDIP